MVYRSVATKLQKSSHMSSRVSAAKDSSQVHICHKAYQRLIHSMFIIYALMQHHWTNPNKQGTNTIYFCIHTNYEYNLQVSTSKNTIYYGIVSTKKNNL